MKKSLSKIVLLAALITNMLIPSAIFNASAAKTTLISLDENMTVTGSDVSETGTVTFNNWVNPNLGSTAIHTKLTTNGSEYKSVEWKQYAANMYEDHISITTPNPNTYSFSNGAIAIEFKFKLKLDNYNAPNLPGAELRLNIPGIIDSELGMSIDVPTQATENTIRTVKYIIDPTAEKVYSSYNGVYATKSFTLPAATPQISRIRAYTRVYAPSLPYEGTGGQKYTELSTPVTWTFESINVWQAPQSEIIQEANIPNYLMDIDNNITYTSWAKFSQTGEIELVKIGESSFTNTSDLINVNQTVMANWKDWFNIKNPTGFSTTRKTTMEVRYKVKLDDYTTPLKPKVYLMLRNNPNNFDLICMPSYTPVEAEKDTWKTLKITVDPKAKKIYSSHNGEPETSVNINNFDSLTDYIANLRLYPVSIPGSASPIDGETPLESHVTWTFDYFKIYDEPLVFTAPNAPIEKFIPNNYLVNIDENIDFNSSTRIASETGNVTFTAWSPATVTGKGAEIETPDVYKQIEFRQIRTSHDFDHIAFNQNIANDKPLVIETKFKAKADDYTGSLPCFKLSLRSNELGIYSGNEIGTQLFVPSATSEDTYHTIKFILDKSEQKAYWSVDGGKFSSKAFPTSILADVFTGIRLNIDAIPSSGSLITNTDPEKGNVSEFLDSPITWTFDYVKAYHVEENEALKLSNLYAEKDFYDENTVHYSVNLVNNNTDDIEFFYPVALYELVGGSEKLISINLASVSSIGDLQIINDTGSFDISGIKGDYFIKAFLWNGDATIAPYDSKLITSSEIN